MALRSSRLLATAFLLIVLAGCVQVRSELTVSEDGLVEGFAEAAFDRAAIDEQSIELDEVLDEYPLDELVATPGIDEDNRVEQVFGHGDDVIAALRFQGVEATDLELFGGSRPFTRTADGGFDFGLAVDTDAYEPGSVLRLQILFPFEVVETNGDLQGSTVRWDVEQGTGTRELTATTSSEVYLSSPAGIGWLGVGLAIAGAFVLGGGSLIWHLTRRAEAP